MLPRTYPTILGLCMATPAEGLFTLPSVGCTSRPNLWLLGDTFVLWGAPSSLPPLNCLYWLLVPSHLPSNCAQLQR